MHLKQLAWIASAEPAVFNDELPTAGPQTMPLGDVTEIPVRQQHVQREIGGEG